MLNNVQAFLDDFKDYVIQQAKSNLTRMKKNSSKTLYNSLKGYVKESKNSIQISFEMDEYGFFQDQGVKGANPSKVSKNAKIKGQQAPNSPYRFGSGTKKGTFDQFASSIARWAQRKNLRLRDSKGKYAKGNYKTIGYIVAGNIYNRGLKPSLFFTKPFEAAFKKLPDELVEKYGLDALELFEEITKENFKK